MADNILPADASAEQAPAPIKQGPPSTRHSDIKVCITKTCTPFSIVYLDDSLLVLLSYCCLRKATRVFRLDRIASVALTEDSFHPKRVALLRKAVAQVQRPESRL